MMYRGLCRDLTAQTHFIQSSDECSIFGFSVDTRFANNIHLLWNLEHKHVVFTKCLMSTLGTCPRRHLSSVSGFGGTYGNPSTDTFVIDQTDTRQY